MFLCIFFGALGLSFIQLNQGLYVLQGLGKSAVYSTLLQTLFSGGQLFGSPILHLISEKVGRKPVYCAAFIAYLITSICQRFADEKIFHGFTIGWIYIMQALQGFFAII